MGARHDRPAEMKLAAWMERNLDRLFLSTITLAEIQSGIAKARRMGAKRKAQRLTHWIEVVLHLYSSRILTFDLASARITGRLADRALPLGYDPGFADLAIAGIAASHWLILLTGNSRHFNPLGIAVHNLFTELSRD